MSDRMDRKELNRAREVSALVFGAKHRLPVAIEVGRGPEEGIYAGMLASRLRTSETQIGVELKRLAAVGLLEALAPAPGTGPGRPVLPYRRRASAYWELAAELGRQGPPKRA